MPTAPAFCDVMRVLAADGKYGNMIVTLLAPDHAHDDGESLVALASTVSSLLFPLVVFASARLAPAVAGWVHSRSPSPQ